MSECTRSIWRRACFVLGAGTASMLSIAATAGATTHVYYDAPPQPNIEQTAPDQYSKALKFTGCLVANTSYTVSITARTVILSGSEGSGEFVVTSTGNVGGVTITPATFPQLEDGMVIDAAVRFQTGAATDTPATVEIRLKLNNNNGGFLNSDSLIGLTVPCITAPTTPPSVVIPPAVVPDGVVQPQGTPVAVSTQPVTTATDAASAAATIRFAAAIEQQACKAASRNIGVRAKRRVTISVKTDRPHARVQIKGGGISTTLTTNSKGVASVRLMPKSSGTVRLTGTGEGCALMVRATVKRVPARQTERKVEPRFAG